MDEIKQSIQRLREAMTAQIEDHESKVKLSEMGAQTREQVVRLLKRDDLRIGPEVLLNDLRNTFARYETFEPVYQLRAVEDALHIVEQLEILVVGEKFLNPDRIEMPDPPAPMARVKSEIERIKTEGRREKERLQRDRQTERDRKVQRDQPPQRERQPQRPPRRPNRGVKQPPAGEEKGRDDLAFADGGAVGAKRRPDRRGGRGRRPEAGPAGADATKSTGPPPEQKPPEGKGPARPGRRPRRRR